MNRKEIDMNNDIELKPCPFCGGTNLYYAAERFYAVECADCGGKVVGTFKTTEEAADAWNTRSQADAPEQAPKSTLKQAVCSIVEILERMKKQMTPDGKDYLAFEIACHSSGYIDISLYSGKAQGRWSLPNDYAENLEDFRSFEISEEKIASFLKAKIKTPEQILKAAIKEKGTELAELKAKLARLEKKGIEWKK